MDTNPWLPRAIILDRKEALRRAGNISKSAEHRLRHIDPTFPKPVRLSPRRVGYYENEWMEWLANRPRVDSAA
jgi:predicted DNA-binding transcriptional regulator AlpA